MQERGAVGASSAFGLRQWALELWPLPLLPLVACAPLSDAYPARLHSVGAAHCAHQPEQVGPDWEWEGVEC